MARRKKEEEKVQEEEPNFPPPSATFVSESEVPRSDVRVQTSPDVQTNPGPVDNGDVERK